jgi:hypothetical protein
MFSSAEVEVKFDHRICRKNAQLVTDLQISLLSNRYIRMFSNCLLPVVVTSMTQAVITLLQGWWRYNKLVSTSLISSARNKLLYGLPNRTDLIKLQRVQNAAARLVTSTRKYDHITRILRELHWLPVKFRIHFKLLLLAFKALHGMAPKYMVDLLVVKVEGNYLLRSNDSIKLEFPKGNFLRSFVAAPKLWNELPKEIRDISSISVFKTCLKTHLFKLAFSI